VPPLSPPRAVQPASLFRDLIEPAKAEARIFYRAIRGRRHRPLPATLLVAPSRFSRRNPGRRGGSAGAAAGCWRKAAPPSCPAARALAAAQVALTNLVRPGWATGGVLPPVPCACCAVGETCGLDSYLLAQPNRHASERHHQRPGVGRAAGARAQLFLCRIQPGETASFDHTITSFSGASDYKRTPMIRAALRAERHGFGKRPRRPTPNGR